MAVPVTDITALVLAGGAGRRSGGADKGLLEWQGRALASHVIERLRPQAGKLLISCNRNLDRYRDYGAALVTDYRAGFQGPLAGLEAAQRQLSTPLLLVSPCDTPLLPEDLAARLARALQALPRAEASFARSADGDHYLCALITRDALATLPAYLDGGGRSVKGWLATLRTASADFDDQPQAFLNLNHLPAQA